MEGEYLRTMINLHTITKWDRNHRGLAVGDVLMMAKENVAKPTSNHDWLAFVYG